MSNKSTMILFSGLALVVGNTFPYTLLGLGAASLTVYAVNRQTPSAKLGRVEDVIMVTEGSSTTRKGKRCKRPTLKYQCQYSNSLLEARSIKTWGEYLEKIKEILQSIDECAKEVKAIQTSILLTIETERRRQLYEGIKEVRETIDVTIVLRYYCAGCVGIKGPGLGRVIAGVVKKILRPKLHGAPVTLFHKFEWGLLVSLVVRSGCTLRELFILSGWRDGEETKLADAEASDSDGQQHAYGQYGADTSGLRSLQRWTRQHSRSKERWRLELRAVQFIKTITPPDALRLHCVGCWGRQHGRRTAMPSRDPPLLTTVFLLLAYCGDGHVKAQKHLVARKYLHPPPTDLQMDAVRLCIAFQSQSNPEFLGAATEQLSCVATLSPTEFRRQSRKHSNFSHNNLPTYSQNKFTARPLVDQFCGPPIRGGIVQLACTNIVTRQIEGKSLALGITTSPDASRPVRRNPSRGRKRISPLFPVSGTPPQLRPPGNVHSSGTKRFGIFYTGKSSMHQYRRPQAMRAY
ncbi:hypothetical protein B0H14DRAFT_3174875 [Mycena olivaceomarginata]|nr:hypothetical protein B0H14DRAFT_3174875 [Mycena olivaceomarginata]